MCGRYGDGRGGGDGGWRNNEKIDERSSKRRDTIGTIWGGNAQDAGGFVGGRERRSGPGEARVVVERGGVMAKTTKGPAP